jgi:hypothetical protein
MDLGSFRELSSERTNWEVMSTLKVITSQWKKSLLKHTLTLRGGGGGELVSGTFGYFSHFHRLTKLTE